MKRSLLFSGVLMLAAQLLCAASPSARTQARLVYDPQSTHSILFGGATVLDAGTRMPYLLDQTWEWTGLRWVQRFPATSPSGRAAQSMAYDPVRARIVLFGGRVSSTAQTNDTWIYKNNNWTRIETPNSPPVRDLAGMTYDPLRDRMVLFGGQQFSADGKSLVNLTDTWEFDGTTWIQRSTTGPAVVKPLLQYDAARNQTLMMALDKDLKTLMYIYDPASAVWNQKTPATLPLCVNESALTYQTHNNTVLLLGGSCNDAKTTASDETYEWNGTDWTKTPVLLAADRYYGIALAYDAARQVSVEFGGNIAFGGPAAITFLYRDGAWIPVTSNDTPSARSLFGFATDPNARLIYLIGGSTDLGGASDFWQYQNGQFTPITATGGPACSQLNASFDTDRKRLVVVCANSDLFEFDGSAWSTVAITNSKNKPTPRRFSSMLYDPSVRKTVLFGGLNDLTYLDETWTWDGTTWTQVKRNPPTSRGLQSMWFDPTLKKTVIFGGIGRITSDDRITRYSDTWTFDGSGWSELKLSTNPGPRYGAQVAVDPRTNRTVLFGGLRVDTNGLVQTQVYANDTWEFDGTAWKQIATPTTPPARENGAIAYDPSLNQLVMFGGYAGHFLSDTWIYTNGNWSVRSESLQRRRSSTSAPATRPPAFESSFVSPQ